MKNKYLLSTAAASLLLSGLSHAQQFTVEVTNLTNGNYFTQLLVTAHDTSVDVFSIGEAASADVETMAESGDVAPLAATLTGMNADVQEVITGQTNEFLAPGTSTSTGPVIDTTSTGNTHLSIVAMILPTNDAFVGLDSWEIPEQAGTYELYLNAYDAGTEDNDEVVDTVNGATGPGIPGAPGGQGGSNGTGVMVGSENTNVHIHRGVLGDTDATGGDSDINSTVHRWLNPVAKVTIVVQ